MANAHMRKSHSRIVEVGSAARSGRTRRCSRRSERQGPLATSTTANGGGEAARLRNSLAARKTSPRAGSEYQQSAAVSAPEVHVPPGKPLPQDALSRAKSAKVTRISAAHCAAEIRKSRRGAPGPKSARARPGREDSCLRSPQSHCGRRNLVSISSRLFSMAAMARRRECFARCRTFPTCAAIAPAIDFPMPSAAAPSEREPAAHTVSAPNRASAALRAGAQGRAARRNARAGGKSVAALEGDREGSGAPLAPGAAPHGFSVADGASTARSRGIPPGGLEALASTRPPALRRRRGGARGGAKTRSESARRSGGGALERCGPGTREASFAGRPAPRRRARPRARSFFRGRARLREHGKHERPGRPSIKPAREFLPHAPRAPEASASPLAHHRAHQAPGFSGATREGRKRAAKRANPQDAHRVLRRNAVLTCRSSPRSRSAAPPKGVDEPPVLVRARQRV